MEKKSLVPALGSNWATPSLRRFRDDMESLFTDFFKDFGNFGEVAAFSELQPKASFPKVNVTENDESYGVEIAIAGFDKDDVNLELKDNVLIVTAEKKEESEEEDKTYLCREISSRSFRRVVRFPKKIDSGSASADYKNGIISMSINKQVVEDNGVVKIDIN